MRLAGQPVRVIAQEAQCLIPDIIGSLIRSTTNTESGRASASRCGSINCIAPTIRRRCGVTLPPGGSFGADQREAHAMLALDSPVKVDVISLQREIPAAPTTTAEIRAALDELLGKTTAIRSGDGSDKEDHQMR